MLEKKKIIEIQLKIKVYRNDKEIDVYVESIWAYYHFNFVTGQLKLSLIRNYRISFHCDWLHYGKLAQLSFTLLHCWYYILFEYYFTENWYVQFIREKAQIFLPHYDLKYFNIIIFHHTKLN